MEFDTKHAITCLTGGVIVCCLRKLQASNEHRLSPVKTAINIMFTYHRKQLVHRLLWGPPKTFRTVEMKLKQIWNWNCFVSVLFQLYREFNGDLWRLVMDRFRCSVVCLYPGRRRHQFCCSAKSWRNKSAQYPILGWKVARVTQNHYTGQDTQLEIKGGGHQVNQCCDRTLPYQPYGYILLVTNRKPVNEPIVSYHDPEGGTECMPITCLRWTANQRCFFFWWKVCLFVFYVTSFAVADMTWRPTMLQTCVSICHYCSLSKSFSTLIRCCITWLPFHGQN